MAMSDRIIVINKGIIQQVGIPTDIYRYPANQFVADFVGKVNFLKGEVKDNSIILTNIGQSIPYDGPYRNKVILTVRPENIIISKEKPAVVAGGFCLKGKLCNMFYLGDVNDCRVDINGENLRVIAESSSFDLFKPGQHVFMGINEFLVYEDKDFSDEIKIVT
jgi:iron(III) transport system ATP-binding protein